MDAQHLEKAISLAERMFKTRDQVRTVLGAGYEQAVAPFKEVIKKKAQGEKKPAVQVTWDCVNQANKHANGMAVNLFTAAYVELTETEEIN